MNLLRIAGGGSSMDRLRVPEYIDIGAIINWCFKNYIIFKNQKFLNGKVIIMSTMGLN